MITYFYSIKNNYLFHLRKYFELVLNPAEGRKMQPVKKKKAEENKTSSRITTPESINLRGSHLNSSNHLRRSPAP